MKVAVLSLCRDRLSYSKHCFETLRENAGCEYDHHVLDQGSQDGTYEWLSEQFVDGYIDTMISEPENIGCCRGWNRLLEACEPDHYDVLVTVDNDCELIEPDTLLTVAGLAAEHEVILSPRVLGLLYPPPTISTFPLGQHMVDETTILGNIFMAIPAPLLVRDGFRWDERYAVWDGGESITGWFRARGGRCGYVQGFHVNHYKTTQGQVDDIPWYFERRVLEGGRAQ